jgi:hypothetical protein
MRELIEMSRDNRAGFLTDRNPAALRKHNADPNKKYELKPYSYDQIIEALLPCILEGYRPHGNEINIISGNGMPVKAGKHRRIIEMTDGYADGYGTPAVKDNYAFIKCRAKWKIDGQTQTLGYDEGDEVHIKIPFGKWDSLDKVLGLSESKFYTRVLRRITGRFIADEPETIDITSEAHEVKPKTSTSTPPPEVKKPDTPPPEQKQTPSNLNGAKSGDQPPEPDSQAPRGVVAEITTLQDMLGSLEYAEVIGRQYKSKTLSDERITAACISKDGAAAQLIIDLLEQSK